MAYSDILKLYLCLRIYFILMYPPLGKKTVYVWSRWSHHWSSLEDLPSSLGLFDWWNPLARVWVIVNVTLFKQTHWSDLFAGCFVSLTVCFLTGLSDESYWISSMTDCMREPGDAVMFIYCRLKMDGVVRRLFLLCISKVPLINLSASRSFFLFFILAHKHMHKRTHSP